MNIATGDDLSINASYAAESVSILFELFVQETTVPDACGRWHREAVRAEQLAYKLIVCAETLQTLGSAAKGLAWELSPPAIALISCLYLESSSIYPALRSAANETRSSGQLASWEWLMSIEHQDWVRSHLACLEGLARVLYLALASHASVEDQDHRPFMELARQRSLHDAQLSSAIKRLSLACETCHLNLRTLDKSLDEPWKDLPWKLIKPSQMMVNPNEVTSAICKWVTGLGKKCGREGIDTLSKDWDTERRKIAARLFIDSSLSNDSNISQPPRERRRSSIRWMDDEGGRLERGSSVLALEGAADQQPTKKFFWDSTADF